MKDSSKKPAFRFLRDLIRPCGGLFALLSLVIAALTAVNLLQTQIITQLVEAASSGRQTDVLRELLFFLAILAANFLLVLFSGICSARLFARSGARLKAMTARRLLDARYDALQELSMGETVATMNLDVDAVSRFLAEQLPQLATQFVMAVAALVYLAAQSPLLLVIVFAYTPIGMFWTMSLNRKMNKIYPENARLRAQALSPLAQALSAVPVIKTFLLQHRIRRILDQSYGALLDSDLRLHKLNAWMQPACHTTSWMPRALLLLGGGLLLTRGQLGLGAFLGIYYLIDFVVAPSVYFPFLLNGLNQAMASVQRVAALQELPSASAMPIRADKGISLKSVGLTRRGKQLFSDLSLEFTGPGLVLLQGPSGCGKSSLLELMAGILTPDSGQVTRCGSCLMADQEGYVFQGTLRENLLLVKPEADEEELERALEKSNAAAFVKDLPRGLDTALGDGGRILSGGQMQRLMLARLFLANPDIWLLDEVTSALDEAGEKAVLQELLQMSKEHLLIAAAHRKVWVTVADRVVDMEARL